MTYKIKGRLLLIAFTVLCFTILIVTETYALFESNPHGTADMDIAVWKISLNDVDLTTTQTLTNNNFTYVVNQHTASNHFAPGTTATFEIEIDASEAEVSVEYEIEIDDSEIDDYDNIYFTITDLSNNQTVTTNTTTGTIPLSANSRVKNYLLTLVWANNPSYDESDTSLIGEELHFPITANFKQYVS